MMTKYIKTFFLVALFGLIMLPIESTAFTLNGYDPAGYNDWYGNGDLNNGYGETDQRWSNEFTGVYYNAAGFLGFSFSIDDTYPTLNDIISDPMRNWQWNLTIDNLVNPFTGMAIPTIRRQGVNSYADFKHGAGWIDGTMGELFNFDGDYIFDCTMTSATTGYASLSLVGNVDAGWWECLPDSYYQGLQSQASVTFSVSSVPEPLTVTLFGLGLAGIAITRRKK